MRLAGIGSHHSARAQTDEWLTPQFVLDALGPFGLDPCANVEHPGRCAPRYYTIEVDGLTEPWCGRVWLNPPYSNVAAWVDRLSEHEDGGTALVFARTETSWWFEYVWPRATAVLFLRGRLTFLRPDSSHARARAGRDGGGGNAGAPSALVAYGEYDAEMLRRSPLAGAFVIPPGAQTTQPG